MIDHTGVKASDLEKSKAFYRAALTPLGYALLMEFPAVVTGGEDVPRELLRRLCARSRRAQRGSSVS